MPTILESADALAEQIERAANRTAESFAAGHFEQEPHFTDRLLGRIDAAVDAFESSGVVWRSRTLKDRGRGAEEREFGADFAGVFSADLPDLYLTKGFLAQAKRLDEDAVMPAAELERLRGQCGEMLRHSPDSFVFLYSRQGVRVVSALAVAGTLDGRLDHLGIKSIGEFYRDHFRCFIGDRALNVPSALGLDRLRSQATGRVLFISVLGF